jgi:hypothetical protein
MWSHAISVTLPWPRATCITLEFHQVQPINLTDLTHPLSLTDPLNRTNLVNNINLINRPHSSTQHNTALSTTIHQPEPHYTERTMDYYPPLEIVDLTPDASKMISLREKVKAGVARYHSTNSKLPPFSAAEIMVMAWVCRRKQNRDYVTDEEVSDWMVLTFGFYKKMALKELYNHSFPQCVTMQRDRTTFLKVVSQRTIQLERIDVPLEVRSDQRGYASTLVGAHRFLRRALGEELAEFKYFFKLPVEVRVLIYEEVFRSRVDGLQYRDAEFHPKSRTRGLRLSQRSKRPCWESQEDFTQMPARTSKVNHWAKREDYPSATEQTSQLMALLLVNRQIFEEAMPVFYGVNHFHVAEPLELTNMLKHCGARRRPHFTSISISYDQTVGPRTAIKAFKLLKDVKRLRRLEVETADTVSTHVLPQLPGIHYLGSVRVRELHFTGDCPLIEAYLRPTMEIKGRDEDKGGKAGKAKAGRKGKSHKSAETVVENADDA